MTYPFKIYPFSLLFLIHLCITSSAQEGVKNNESTNDTLYKQLDIIDISYYLTNWKYLIREHDSIKLKPGKILFSGNPALGYTIQTGITALFSANISFYTGHRANTYLSSINLAPEYSIYNHQIILPIIFKLWLKDNKYTLSGDWRYYKYPSYTYGLGSDTRVSNYDLIDYSYYRIYQDISKRIANNVFLGLGYGLDYHFDIQDKTNNTNFNSYNQYVTKTVSSGLIGVIAYDNRSNINNPQGGTLASISYRPNLKFFGSDKNWQLIHIDVRKYFRFPSRSKNILAFWNYNWLSFGGKAPYLDLPSTAWDTYSNVGRGYIQGRLRGPMLIYFETEYRISLSKNGLLGAVVFANAQSVSEYSSNKFQKIFPATGAGLRIKLNKYSKVNFAVDYAFGINNSNGLFFNICEVF